MSLYNKLPLWLRGIILGAGSIMIIWYGHMCFDGIATQKQMLQRTLDSIQVEMNLLQDARSSNDTMIFENQLLDPQEMKKFLEEAMASIPGISIIQVSLPKKEPLADYLYEKEENNQQRSYGRGENRPRNMPDFPREYKKRMETIQNITGLLNIRTEDLMAQKILIDFYGSYEGTLKYLDIITQSKDILWNKIDYTVEQYPTARVKLQLYAIVKKENNHG